MRDLKWELNERGLDAALARVEEAERFARAALQAIEHDREEMERQIKDAIWSSRFVPNPEAPEAIEKRIRGRQEPMLAERKARAEAMPD